MHPLDPTRPEGPAAAEPPDLAGREVDGYQVLALLGTGSMGRVYKAFDPRCGRLVALKLVAAAPHQQPQRTARGQREVEALGVGRGPGPGGPADAGEGPVAAGPPLPAEREPSAPAGASGRSAPSYGSLLQQAVATKSLSALRQLSIAVEQAWAEEGVPPADLPSLAEAFGLHPRALVDGWGRDILYRPAADGYRLISAGADGEPGSADDLVIEDGYVVQGPEPLRPPG